jgi:hypothetical protein
MATFCGQCGQPTTVGAARCGQCGAPVSTPQMPTAPSQSPWGESSSQGWGSAETMPAYEWPTATRPPTAHAGADPTWQTPGAYPRGAGMPPSPPSRSTPTALIAGLVALVLVVVGGLVYFFVVRPRQAEQSTAPVTVVVTRRPTTAGAGSTNAATTPGGATTQPSAPASTTSAPPSPALPTYPPLQLTGQLCATTGAGPWANAASGNAQTSCPFAIAVQAAYVTVLGSATTAPATPVAITAHSTVTNKDYMMSCVGDQPVTCTGGNNAVVYLYGGAATFTP